MIKNLHLKNFGRFQNKTFNFSPVTIFFGHNEAGKTTIFDALFSVISSPRGSSKEGRALNERYGKDRLLDSEFDGEPFQIDEKDFLNLFAIRSGSINLEIEDNSQWLNQVKASLFSGGVNPQAVMSKLDSIIKGSGKSSLNGEAKRLTEELQNLKKEKEQNEAERQKCFDEEKRIESNENRLSEVTGEIAKLEAGKRQLEQTLKQQSLLNEEKTYEFILSVISDKQRKTEELEKYSRLNSNVLNTLKTIDEKAVKLKEEETKAAAREEEALLELSACKKEKVLYEEKKNKGESIRILADHLTGTLVPREKLVSTKTERKWRKPFLAAAALFFVAGTVVFLFSNYNWIILAITMGLSLICAAVSPVRRTWDDTSLLDNAIQAAIKSWQNETGEVLNPRYEDILTALNGAAQKSRNASDDFKRMFIRVNELEQKAQEYALQKKQANTVFEANRQEFRRLLNEAGTADIHAYTAQLERKNSVILQNNELEEKLKTYLAQYSASSVKELEEVISRKKAEIGRDITETQLPPQEIRIRENQLREITIRLEALRHEDKENISAFSKDIGTIRGQLKGLPEKIASCEKSILEKEARLAEINRELRAAKIAYELFSKLAADSDVMLEQLSLEIGETFSALTENVRAINMKGYSTDNISVTDAEGAERENRFLSAGTRDAFLFAARLTLAKKSMEGGCRAILVLDDPFLALDRPRTGRALALLNEFHKATQWQIVFLTKDEEIIKQAYAAFGREICVNELGSSGFEPLKA